MTTTYGNETRMRHLALANSVRSARKLKLDEIRSLEDRESSELAASLIESPPDYFRSLLLYDLLSAVKHVGRSKARTILRKTEVPAYLTVGELTDRQREVVVSRLMRRHS